MTATAGFESLLREAYEAFNARNLERLLALLHPDVMWPNAHEGGLLRGRANVRAYWQQQWSTINPKVEPLGFATEPDGRVCVDVRQTVHDLARKLLVDRRLQHVFRLSAGWIESMEIREL